MSWLDNGNYGNVDDGKRRQHTSSLLDVRAC